MALLHPRNDRFWRPSCPHRLLPDSIRGEVQLAFQHAIHGAGGDGELPSRTLQHSGRVRHRNSPPRCLGRSGDWLDVPPPRGCHHDLLGLCLSQLQGPDPGPHIRSQRGGDLRLCRRSDTRVHCDYRTGQEECAGWQVGSHLLHRRSNLHSNLTSTCLAESCHDLGRWARDGHLSRRRQHAGVARRHPRKPRPLSLHGSFGDRRLPGFGCVDCLRLGRRPRLAHSLLDRGHLCVGRWPGRFAHAHAGPHPELDPQHHFLDRHRPRGDDARTPLQHLLLPRRAALPRQRLPLVAWHLPVLDLLDGTWCGTLFRCHAALGKAQDLFFLQ
mmetsp:Transcript_30433/g.65541  ORF Transcript_30433/g.65541 Transcript_30433/m.65541 type:complete len:327 (+) Transcript_30433:251-1231(+)